MVFSQITKWRVFFFIAELSDPLVVPYEWQKFMSGDRGLAFQHVIYCVSASINVIPEADLTVKMQIATLANKFLFAVRAFPFIYSLSLGFHPTLVDISIIHHLRPGLPTVELDQRESGTP